MRTDATPFERGLFIWIVFTMTLTLALALGCDIGTHEGRRQCVLHPQDVECVEAAKGR